MDDENVVRMRRKCFASELAGSGSIINSTDALIKVQAATVLCGCSRMIELNSEIKKRKVRAEGIWVTEQMLITQFARLKIVSLEEELTYEVQVLAPGRIHIGAAGRT
jgi:hypothetical protein